MSVLVLGVLSLWFLLGVEKVFVFGAAVCERWAVLCLALFALSLFLLPSLIPEYVSDHVLYVLRFFCLVT